MIFGWYLWYRFRFSIRGYFCYRFSLVLINFSLHKNGELHYKNFGLYWHRETWADLKKNVDRVSVNVIFVWTRFVAKTQLPFHLPTLLTLRRKNYPCQLNLWVKKNISTYETGVERNDFLLMIILTSTKIKLLSTFVLWAELFLPTKIFLLAKRNFLPMLNLSA